MDVSNLTIGELIGEGSGGFVYRIPSTNLCLKLIECLDKSDIRTKIANITTCSKLSNKHIIKIHAIGKIDSQLEAENNFIADIYEYINFGIYVVMDYLENYCTLCTIVPVSESICLSFMKEIVDVLEYIYYENVINYDIALRNIMIKIVDDTIVDFIFIDPESFIKFDQCKDWRGKKYGSFTYNFIVNNYKEVDFIINDDRYAMITPELTNGMIHPNTMSWALGLILFEMLFGTKYALSTFINIEHFVRFVEDKMKHHRNFRCIISETLELDANYRSNMSTLKELINSITLM